MLSSSSAAPPCGPQYPVVEILLPAVPSGVCNQSCICWVANDVVVVRSPPSGDVPDKSSPRPLQRYGRMSQHFPPLKGQEDCIVCTDSDHNTLTGRDQARSQHWNLNPLIVWHSTSVMAASLAPRPHGSRSLREPRPSARRPVEWEPCLKFAYTVGCREPMIHR